MIQTYSIRFYSALLLFISSILFGQQEFQMTHYVINPFLTNPAHSSIEDFLEAKVGYRNQWGGIEGRPETYYLSVQSPVGKPHWAATHPGDFKNWHGTGGFIMQDNIGPYSNLRVNLNYSYNMKITQGPGYGYEHEDGLRVAVGAFVGWMQYSTDRSMLSQNKVSDWSRVTNDLAVNDPTYLILAEQAAPAMDMTLGSMIYYNNKYFLGISSSQIFQSRIRLTEETLLARHYFISSMVKLDLGEHWYLIPSTMFKMVRGAPLSYDVSARMDWEDKAFFGAGYRHQDAVTLMMGIRYKWGEKIKNFRRDKHRYTVIAYYSYDITTSRLASSNLRERSQGSHEITLGFLLPPMYVERNAEDTWGKSWRKAHPKR